jgi:hypothetical protein
MKDFLKTVVSSMALAIALALPMTLAAYDGSFPLISINKVDGEKRFSLVMKDLKAPTTLRLGNNSQGTLLEEQVDGSDYAKIFSLRDLEIGVYILSIETGVREIEQTIVVKADDIEISPRARREFYAPTIKATEDHVDLMHFNSELTNLEVEIQDNEGRKMFFEELNNVVKVEKRYNLSKLPKGQYTFIVSTSNKTYMQEITVKK